MPLQQPNIEMTHLSESSQNKSITNWFLWTFLDLLIFCAKNYRNIEVSKRAKFNMSVYIYKSQWAFRSICLSNDEYWAFQDNCVHEISKAGEKCCLLWIVHKALYDLLLFSLKSRKHKLHAVFFLGFAHQQQELCPAVDILGSDILRLKLK